MMMTRVSAELIGTAITIGALTGIREDTILNASVVENSSQVVTMNG